MNLTKKRKAILKEVISKSTFITEDKLKQHGIEYRVIEGNEDRPRGIFIHFGDISTPTVEYLKLFDSVDDYIREELKKVGFDDKLIERSLYPLGS